MRARILFGLAIVGLTLLPVTSASAQGAEARGFGGAVTHALTARVPSVVRVALAADRLAPDGTPMLRIETNDPAIRRRIGMGLAAEPVSRDAVARTGPRSESASGHAKGANEAAEEGMGAQVVRYTLVTP